MAEGTQIVTLGLTKYRSGRNIGGKVVDGKIVGGIEIDAFLTEEHTESNDVPDHPIESGYSVNDSIIRRPTQLRLEGIITANPLGVVQNDSDGRAEDTIRKLRDLAKSKQLFNVFTSFTYYENMAIVEFSVPRDGELVSSFKFNMVLRHVKIANTSSKSVNNPNAIPSVAANNYGPHIPITPIETTTSSVGSEEGVYDPYYYDPSSRMWFPKVPIIRPVPASDATTVSTSGRSGMGAIEAKKGMFSK